MTKDETKQEQGQEQIPVKPTDRVIDQIQKLFTLADKNRNNNEAEAMAALAKAQEIMSKYNLEMAQIENTARRGHKKVEDRQFVPDAAAPLQWAHTYKFSVILGHAVAKLTTSDVIWSFPNGKKTLTFIGEAKDVAIASALFHVLLKSGLGIAYHKYDTKFTVTPEVRSWMIGYVDAIAQRARESKHTEGLDETQAQCVALAIQTKEDWLAKQVEAMNLTPGRKSRGKGVYSSCYIEGQIEGRKADLGVGNKLTGSKT